MNPGRLVSTVQLAAHLDDPQWIVADCRHDLANPDAGRAAYAQAHIPGARFFHLDHDLSGPRTGKNGRHPLPDPEKFAAALEKAGIGPGSRVIAYDAQGGMNATRLWWLMRWIGHDRVSVLDGGWKAWIAEARPQSTESPVTQASRLVPAVQPIAALAPEIVASIRSLPLLDARTAERYRGRNETMDPVAGRIPGAMNRFFMHNLADDGRFKAIDMLKREFMEVLGTTSPAKLVNYCGSGVSACHNIFAMELAGLHGSRLYPGSWSEWCADPTRPIAQGEPTAGETA